MECNYGKPASARDGLEAVSFEGVGTVEAGVVVLLRRTLLYIGLVKTLKGGFVQPLLPLFY